MLTARLLDRYLYLSGTSNARFAALAKVSETTVYNWREGVYSPGYRSLTQIIEGMNKRNGELSLALDLSAEVIVNDALCRIP